MKNEHFKNLQDTIELSKKSLLQFEGQIDNLEGVFAEAIKSLGGEEKQKVQHLQAMVNRTIGLAKNGGDYEAEIEKIKETFKGDTNGRNSNK